MKLNTLGFVILSTVSMQAAADKEYWFGSDGAYVHDRNGHCVRTGRWTPEAAIPGCEGGEAKVAAEETAVAEEKSTLAKAEPVAVDADKSVAPAVVAAAATTTAGVAAYRNLTLASGATFETGGSTLSSEGKAEVAALMTKFEGESVSSVVIAGYTDDSGDASFNQQLSEKRAEAVKAELVANGADPDKITTVGYGESNPIADNATRDGRAKNRRVEIKVDAKERQL